jgi:quinol monooxygenase YgiN
VRYFLDYRNWNAPNAPNSAIQEHTVKKFILGTFTCRPGTRDAFIVASLPYAQATREEEGCIFFELSAKPDDPDVALLMECFVSDEAHKLHHTLPHFKALIAELQKVMVSSDVLYHYADELLRE